MLTQENFVTGNVTSDAETEWQAELAGEPIHERFEVVMIRRPRGAAY